MAGRYAGCIAALSRSIDCLKADGEMIDIETETDTCLINGGSGQWLGHEMEAGQPLCSLYPLSMCL